MCVLDIHQSSAYLRFFQIVATLHCLDGSDMQVRACPAVLQSRSFPRGRPTIAGTLLSCLWTSPYLLLTLAICLELAVPSIFLGSVVLQLQLLLFFARCLLVIVLFFEFMTLVVNKLCHPS
jgi:hypothetical protein